MLLASRIESETPATYKVDPKNDDDLIQRAIIALGNRLRQPESYIKDPDDAKKLAFLKLGERESEAFCCLWLDNRHGLIAFETLFTGTIDGATIHPREVVKRAMRVNAAAVVFAHNHPSGDPSPSIADKRITERLREAMALVDVSVLDHVIVGRDVVSMAEDGLI